VHDPEARRLAHALSISSTPFAVEVERGSVTRKAHLYDGASDLLEFVEAKKVPSRTKANATVVVRKEGASERVIDGTGRR
jgi:hypothetical protein